MKKMMFAIIAGLFLSVAAYGQKGLEVNKEGTFYSVPVPEGLQNHLSTTDKTEKTTVKSVKRNGMDFSVKIIYNPKANKELVYSLGVRAEKEDVNEKLSKMNSSISRPPSISACYFANLRKAKDWNKLASCVVDYAQAFL